MPILFKQLLGWRRKWQPTPIFLPGKFHGLRTLVGYSPQGRRESDTTERVHFHFQPNKQKAEILLTCHPLSPPPREEPCRVSYCSRSHRVRCCRYPTPSCMLGEPLTHVSALPSQWSVLVPLLDGRQGSHCVFCTALLKDGAPHAFWSARGSLPSPAAGLDLGAVLPHWKRPQCWEGLKAGGEGETEDEMAGWHH